MNIYNEETEFNVTHIPVFQRVVDMYQGRPDFQQILRLGLLAKMGYGDELDAPDDDNYEYDPWVHSNPHRYPRPSDRSNDRGLGRNYTRSPGSAYQLPRNYYTLTSDPLPPPSVKVQAKESDTERRAQLLQEAKKSKEKAEKKRLKKQKQKKRKQLEKLEKEKQNPVKTEEEKNDGQESTADGSKPVNDKSHSTVKDLASAKDRESSDSSEVESSDEDSDTQNDFSDSEELDMTSTFVSKAALIARRKLEKNSRPENKEKKKTPVKEELKTIPDKQNEDPKAEKKDPPFPDSPTVEDNIKISTDLANLGNRFASAGDFNMAVKYFTDAIKYNPKEFKLFGNRSFCFEKMQEYMKALRDAELCLTMCPGWVKGLFRKGRALAGLKRYDEAADAFREVLKVDSSCAEAAQELMRVQITQLMGYGFTREQSSNALIIHGTVEKAIEVLSQLNPHQGVVHKGSLPLAQVANVSGVSPVLSANTSPGPHQSQGAPKTLLQNKPLGPVQNVSNLKSQPKPGPVKATDQDNHPTQELFPVWVGNLFFPVTETVIANLFNKVGNVYSVKVLTYRRCAFVNYTKQEHCEEAIRRFHGYELSGVKIAVRYPDRIPKGMGISKSALRADDLQDENVGQNDYATGRNAAGSRRPGWPHRPPLDHRSNQSSTSANCLK